jgi:uncharacterized membrane protein YgaE (UPF0421/DUF939 family)
MSIARDVLNKSPVGLRSIKTALAVILAASVAKYILKDTPFFACIGAVVAMESSIARSVKAAIIRNVGTFAGGAMGILTGMVFQSAVSEHTVLLGLGVIPLIFIINLTKRPESIVSGCVTFFAAVFLNGPGNIWDYGTTRILGTFMGTVVALAVNWLVFPPKTEEQKPKAV